MDKNRIKYLHQRYVSGGLSPDEAAEWEHVVHAPEHEATIHSLMRTTWGAITPESQQSMPLARSNRIFKRVVQPPRIRTLRPWLRVAAILVIASAAVWLFWNRQQPPVEAVLTTQDVAPGGSRATLSLADGTTIDLSSEQAGIIVTEGITYLDGSAVFGEQVNRGASEQVSVGASEQVQGGERNSKFTSSQVHSLTTPKGGTYQITLPDGTKVWLNAASTLKYPSRFDGNERVVELAGEAYFDVNEQAHRLTSSLAHKLTNSLAHKLTNSQKIPFKVISNGQVVEVLGTEFNINAYPDENSTTTTLVTGRVNVTVNGGTPAEVHRLTPGKQSILRQGAIHIREVDVDQHTAWRDGRFNFDGKSLPQVMRELARWYGIKVAYEGKAPDIEFYGGIRRNHNLATIMGLLETNGIHYRLAPDTTLVLSTADRIPE